MKPFLLTLLLTLSLPAMASTDPEQLIRETSDKVLDEIKSNGEVYREDPKRIYELVDTVVLPHFDFSAMTDLALGRYRVDSRRLRSRGYGEYCPIDPRRSDEARARKWTVVDMKRDWKVIYPSSAR